MATLGRFATVILMPEYCFAIEPRPPCLRATIMLVMALAGAAVSPAQTTWSNLRFGMSRTEVEQTLAAKNMKITSTRNAPDVFSVTPVYELTLPDLNKPIPFNPELTFSEDKLGTIGLNLDTDVFVKVIGNLDAAIILVNNSIKDALTAKYGAAIEVSQSCSVSNGDLVTLLLENSRVECKATWRGDAQLISVWWLYRKQPQSFFYYLSYKSAPSGL